MSAEPTPPPPSEADHELLEKALAALSHSPEDLRTISSPELTIVTSKSAHEGIDAAVAWAAKTYDHLDRHYHLEHLHERDETVHVRGRVEYIWRESGELGDSSPSFFAARIEDGLLTRLAIGDDEASAEAQLCR